MWWWFWGTISRSSMLGLEKCPDELFGRRLKRPEEDSAGLFVARDVERGAEIAGEIGKVAFGTSAGWEAQFGDGDRFVHVECVQFIDGAVQVIGESLTVVPMLGVASAFVRIVVVVVEREDIDHISKPQIGAFGAKVVFCES